MSYSYACTMLVHHLCLQYNDDSIGLFLLQHCTPKCKCFTFFLDFKILSLSCQYTTLKPIIHNIFVTKDRFRYSTRKSCGERLASDRSHDLRARKMLRFNMKTRLTMRELNNRWPQEAPRRIVHKNINCKMHASASPRA